MRKGSVDVLLLGFLGSIFTAGFLLGKLSRYVNSIYMNIILFTFGIMLVICYIVLKSFKFSETIKEDIVIISESNVSWLKDDSTEVEGTLTLKDGVLSFNSEGKEVCNIHKDNIAIVSSKGENTLCIFTLDFESYLFKVNEGSVLLSEINSYILRSRNTNRSILNDLTCGF